MNFIYLFNEYNSNMPYNQKWERRNTWRTHFKKWQSGSPSTQFWTRPAWNKWKKLSEEHKKKLKWKREKASWERNHNWKGGVTPENMRIRKSFEYKLWRQAVFERDNYTCVWCGWESHWDIEADHIKPFSLFPELRFAIDNGRTLCKTCHKTTDTYWFKLLYNK